MRCSRRWSQGTGSRRPQGWCSKPRFFDRWAKLHRSTWKCSRNGGQHRRSRKIWRSRHFEAIGTQNERWNNSGFEIGYKEVGCLLRWPDGCAVPRKVAAWSRQEQENTKRRGCPRHRWAAERRLHKPTACSGSQERQKGTADRRIASGVGWAVDGSSPAWAAEFWWEVINQICGALDQRGAQRVWRAESSWNSGGSWAEEASVQIWSW